MDIFDKKAELGQALNDYLGEPKREAYKKGDKFTMEITEVLISEDGSPMFRLNGFTNLLVDEEMLDSSTKIMSPLKPAIASLFDRQNAYADYYYIDDTGDIDGCTERYDEIDAARYVAGNYCRDEDLMVQRALDETLNRLLWRYSETHGGSSETYTPWIIIEESGEYKPCITSECHCLGSVEFPTRDAANAAINTVIKPFIQAHPAYKPFKTE